jgi:hypothetical protein
MSLLKVLLKQICGQIKKGVHLNLTVGLIRLIKLYLEVLSQTDIEEFH